MSEYWFARRYPLGDMRSGMAPINLKGWLVAVAFCVGLALGGAAFWWFASNGLTVKGALSFAVIAGVSALGFIRVANQKGDHVNCIKDYHKGKLRA
ncbi:MAG: hypothetical protein K2P58_09905 [Hyphomonadaceae bacterium]|nr:hypothetical protein [Hyphomonadaceae bacterium]